MATWNSPSFLAVPPLDDLCSRRRRADGLSLNQRRKLCVKLDCSAYRLEDALVNSRIAGHPLGKTKIYASVSRNCLARDFDDYPSEASIVDERISYELLGKSGAELARKLFRCAKRLI